MSDPENINSNTHLLNENYKKTTKKKLKDPLLVQTVSLHEDVYALTWNCLRIKSWENKKIHDQEIFLTGWDKTKLVLHFIFFIIVVIATVGILLYESFVLSLPLHKENSNLKFTKGLHYIDILLSLVTNFTFLFLQNSCQFASFSLLLLHSLQFFYSSAWLIVLFN
jgi:hypothetical protein